MLAIAVVGIVFVFIGNMNTLGPVVTMPFMITYAAVDYAYFVLAVSYDRVSKRHELLGVQEAARKANEKQTTRGYGTLGGGKNRRHGPRQSFPFGKGSAKGSNGSRSERGGRYNSSTK